MDGALWSAMKIQMTTGVDRESRKAWIIRTGKLERGHGEVKAIFSIEDPS